MPDKRKDAYHVEPGQEIMVERFRPQDAPGVVACFQRVYGDGYPIQTYYNPAALIRENQTRRIISVVARTVGGQVVGHNALFNSDPCNLQIYESGSGVVLPEYRNTARLFTRMVMLGAEIGKAQGVEGIYGEPVCNHTYSQKLVHNMGFLTSALEVDLMPAAAYVKEGSAPGRVSSFWSFKTLTPKPHTVYVPQIYIDFFEFAYRELDDARRVETTAEPLPQSVATRIEAQQFDFAQVVRMATYEMGSDFRQALLATEREARKRGDTCFQIWLDLGVPWVSTAVDILRQESYFLGGLLARWFDTDGILMQKLLKRPCWKDIQVAFDRDRFIVDTVRKDWQCVSLSR